MIFLPMGTLKFPLVAGTWDPLTGTPDCMLDQDETPLATQVYHEVQCLHRHAYIVHRHELHCHEARTQQSNLMHIQGL